MLPPSRPRIFAISEFWIAALVSPRWLRALPLALGALALLAGGSPSRAQSGGNLPVYTSPIDITGLKLVLRLAAPDRETGKLIDVALPVDLLGPQMNQMFGTPLSTQIDQYWNTKVDPNTGMTARQAACDGKAGVKAQRDGIKQQVAKEVAKLGSSYSAYDVTCELAPTGKLVVKQVGSTLFIGYLLTGNKVSFASTSPDTCRAGSGTPVCPNDPRFTVTFATELTTVLRTPSLCQLTGENGTVYVTAASIDAKNGAAAVAKFFGGQKFVAAEVAITNTVQAQPLPIDAAFKELRTSAACTGKIPGISRVLTAFRQLDTEIDLRQGIILRAVHAGITAPKLDAPNPGGAAPSAPSTPSFTRPTISTSQPQVKAGTTVQLHGQYFPLNLNFATALPVTVLHGGYGKDSTILGGLCVAGGGTDMESGPAGAPRRVQRLAGDPQGKCPDKFNAANLTPGTTYQFRARDCDTITCSPWSALLSATTAKADARSGRVILTLDGGTALGSAFVNAQGTFDAPIAIPAATPAGPHTIHALSGAAKAEETIQVVAPAAGGGAKASLMMVGLLKGETGCPNHPISSAQTDDTITLFGAGFAPGTVSVRLDTAAGAALGTAPVRPDGSICQAVRSPGGNMAGKHTIVAVQNGAAVAQLPVTFVLPSVVR